MIAETKRLQILEATLNDGEFFYELMNTPNWLKFIGDRNIDSPETAVIYIRDKLMTGYNEDGFSMYKVLLKDNATPIGVCGILQRDYLPHPDIGFALLPSYENQGYTTEAALAIKAWAADHLGFNTLLGITLEENHASKKVLTKIGMFFKEKIVRDGEMLLVYRSC